MGIKERKKERTKDKVTFSLLLFLILFILYYYDYNFTNNLYNGLILFIFTILLHNIVRNNKYYIETGLQPSESEGFKLFNQMHPFIALQNKLLAVIFVVMMIISAVMIISSFF